MKKKKMYYLLSVIMIFLIGSSVFWNGNHPKNTETLEKIKLAEVAHTVFYAPMYVSIENKYFEEEGIDLELFLANGADKVTAALLSKDADIGFCGSEATIYVYNGGEKDYLKTFAQLTQKDGSFLVSREKYSSFTLEDLKGKTIIGGRAAGMPEMTLEYALKTHGMDPRKEVEIDTSIAFASMGGAFISGQGDFVTLFEPTATIIEKQGYGYVVASIGELGGNVPYTSYSARISYIQEHKELIKKFIKAIQKGLDYVHTHTNEEIASIILPQFADSSKEELADAIKRYQENDTWPLTTEFSKESFDHLQDIMIDYGELKEKVNYQDLMYK